MPACPTEFFQHTGLLLSVLFYSALRPVALFESASIAGIAVIIVVLIVA
jgi:hypothetical protein